jgi:hypothetical protein
MKRSLSHLIVAFELVTIYALVQGYIWRWQYTQPQLVWLILLLLVSSHLAHRDTAKRLGFRFDNFAVAAHRAGLWAVPFLLVLVVVGFWTGRLWELPFRLDTIWPGVRYSLWGLFQQYGLQGFFHNRLMGVSSSRSQTSLLNGLIFMSFHIPNPVLMIFTLAGGIVLSRIYAETRNLFVLGIFHGLTGLLLSNTFPRAWLHNMRVGPGYYR